jgi:hypothetical protein
MLLVATIALPRPPGSPHVIHNVFVQLPRSGSRNSTFCSRRKRFAEGVTSERSIHPSLRSEAVFAIINVVYNLQPTLGSEAQVRRARAAKAACWALAWISWALSLTSYLLE